MVVSPSLVELIERRVDHHFSGMRKRPSQVPRRVVVPEETLHAVRCARPAADMGDQVDARHDHKGVVQVVSQVPLPRPVARRAFLRDRVESSAPVVAAPGAELRERVRASALAPIRDVEAEMA